MQPVNKGRNTEDAFTFILPSSGPSESNPVYLSTNLLDDFEDGDNRKALWIDTLILGSDSLYYAYKYVNNTLNAPLTEYLTVLRLSEQYLIRAESKVHLGDISGALTDLNIVRLRAGLTSVVLQSAEELQSTILNERRG